MTPAQLLTAQKIISTKRFQSQFASVVNEARKKGTYYNVVRNSESIGVFLPTAIWEALVDDLTDFGALSQSSFKKIWDNPEDDVYQESKKSLK